MCVRRARLPFSPRRLRREVFQFLVECFLSFEEFDQSLVLLPQLFFELLQLRDVWCGATIARKQFRFEFNAVRRFAARA